MQVDDFNGDWFATSVVPALENLAGVTTAQLFIDIIAVVFDPHPERSQAIPR